MNPDLNTSGTALASTINSKKLDRLTIAVWALVALILALAVGGYWFLDHYNIVDYIIYRYKIGGC